MVLFSLILRRHLTLLTLRKVQTTVKAAVSTLLSLDSICLSKKLEIPLYVVWQIK